MKVEVFDDKLSLMHIIASIITYFYLQFIFIFLLYEIVEFTYKYRKGESIAIFLGDIFEFCIGFTFISLFFAGL